MPGFDGTGPRGEGPMTGGGRGYCAAPAGQQPTAADGTAAATPNPQPQNLPPAGFRGPGLGLGPGRGWGRGRRGGGGRGRW